MSGVVVVPQKQLHAMPAELQYKPIISLITQKPVNTKTEEISTYTEGNDLLPELTNVGGQCSSRACSTRQPRFTVKPPTIN